MTFFTFSLGCKINSYECAAISHILVRDGFSVDENNPDVVIINTCSVTHVADQKSRQHIRKFKNLYPHAIIVVMGCYSQGNYEYVANEIKADIILGTSHRNEIPDLIEEFKNNHQQIVKVENNIRKLCYEELGITSYSENIRAYLKIQDGCNNFCSYCLIPYRRGSSRSRKKEEVIEEAKYLIKKGYKEIVLTGIDVSSYGKDIGEYDFTDLVKELLTLENLPSLRISSIEAGDMSLDLIKLYKDDPKLARHMHIPLQSGSTEVMKRMHRKYTKEDYLSKIRLLREYCPDIMISTDVITGFIGETDEEFLETRNFIIECGFNQLHVFPFSPRNGTLAFSMPNKVDDKTKKERTSNLLELSKTLWEEYTNKYIDKEIDVLIEKYDKKNKVNIGHTSNYIEVQIPSNEGKIGSVLRVKLQKSMIISK